MTEHRLQERSIDPMLKELKVDIIAFKLHDQDFCVDTTSVREIRGWGKSTPIPHAPPEVLGVMTLRGNVIPIIDLAAKLGMQPVDNSDRSAIVVAEIGETIIGLVMDGVTDLVTIDRQAVQPLPETTRHGQAFSHGIITHDIGMICYLDLESLFADADLALAA